MTLRRSPIKAIDETYISSGHHDTVRFFQDFIKVIDPLLVFNFGNDQGTDSLFPIHVGKFLNASFQKGNDRPHIGAISNKGGCNKVGTDLTGPFQIASVLVGQGRKIQFQSRKVDTLVLLDGTGIQSGAHNEFPIRIDFHDFQGNQSIIQQDHTSNLDRLGNTHIVNLQFAIMIAFGGDGLLKDGFGSHNDFGTRFNHGHILISWQRSGADLRSLGIDQDRSQIVRNFNSLDLAL